jgi:hypothetical protein
MTSEKKRRGPGRPFAKGKGAKRDPRINTAGCPKGDTWRTILNKLLSMDGPAIAEFTAAQGREFQKLPSGVPLRVLICVWMIASLSRDFSASTWKTLMDRSDGTLSDALEERLLRLEELAEEKSNGKS